MAKKSINILDKDFLGKRNLIISDYTYWQVIKSNIYYNMYNILMSKKVARAVATMPKAQQEKLVLLVDDIRQNGPVRANWPNYGILAGSNTHIVIFRTSGWLVG